MRRTGALLHWQPVQLRSTSSFHSARAQFASDYVTYLIAGFYIVQVCSVTSVAACSYHCCLHTEDRKLYVGQICTNPYFKGLLLYNMFVFLSWHFYQRAIQLHLNFCRLRISIRSILFQLRAERTNFDFQDGLGLPRHCLVQIEHALRPSVFWPLVLWARPVYKFNDCC